ncbi:MAG: OmpA family protein [Tannerella sp.]|jgi:outer membrane protein OmpA-like peptidoglycan-associated protein|nr:OmpA family protein [Tannerella sp.]
MKIKVLLFAFLCGAMMTVTAQQYQPQVGFSTENGSKTNFKKNAATDNVFVSIGGGLSALFGDQNSEAGLGDRLNWAGALSVGKWYNPYFAYRLQLNGGQLKNFYYAIQGGSLSTTLVEQDFLYGNLHADLMWDVTNYWAPYNEKKVVRVIPFVGIGYAIRAGKYSQEFKRSESPSVNLGIQIPIRLSQRVDLFLEGQYALYNEAFNRIDMGQEEDRVFQGLVGFNFKLGRTDFEVIEPMDYDLLNDLNSQINALRAQNDELSKRPKSCPDCPKAVPVVESIESLKNVVFFRLNSSVIDKNQEGFIFNTSEYAKKHNLPVKVVGYADKKTGTADYNHGLSERRAKAVAKRLSEKYGIPTEKISIEWKGDTQQPYEINNWNRVVIMDTNK